MIGTAIIALVGYGLAVAFAWSSALRGWQAACDKPRAAEDLPHSVEFVLNAVASVGCATATRWLVGGQF